MRTITFEVEVDDEIIHSLAPSIYDDVFKNAPDGQLFLCKSRTSVAKQLVRLHRDAEEGGKETPWFENHSLPDDMRVVGMSGGNAAEYINGKSKMMSELEPKQESVGPNKDAVMESIGRVDNLIACLTQRHYESHQELLNHFKQVHEYHNGESKYFAEAENRITERVISEIRDAAKTAHTGNEIILALTNIEGRIKEYIRETYDAPVKHDTDEVSPKALLKALEIVSRTITNA